MKIQSVLHDHRIKAANVLVDLSIREYLEAADEIIDKNELQRKKVIKGSVSNLLKNDLKIGCTIPPVVLAIKSGHVPTDFDYKKFDLSNQYQDLILEKFSSKDLLIIDGLQRTHVIRKIRDDFEKEIISNPEAKTEYEKFLNQLIRAEIYVGLDKLGILYRMLTLNTGQTTMSTRHLMEILYLDYLDVDLGGIKIIPDKEERVPAKNSSEYKFKDVLDGFNSYLEGSEVLIKRADILDNVKTINSLDKEDKEKDSFKEFMLSFKKFLDKMLVLTTNATLNETDFEGEFKLNGPRFGNDNISIFKRSQVLTGFGAAISILKKRRNLNFDSLNQAINSIKISEEFNSKLLLVKIVKAMDIIRDMSGKVGNDQRYFFKLFFRYLFDSEDDYPGNLNRAIDNATRKTKEKMEDDF